MDKDALVNSLREAFEKTDYKVVEAFMLVPAFPGLMKNSYILGVSVPGYSSDDDYAITDHIIDYLFMELSELERRQIDRVRVYHSIEELENKSRTGFDSYGFEDVIPFPELGKIERVAA